MYSEKKWHNQREMYIATFKPIRSFFVTVKTLTKFVAGETEMQLEYIYKRTLALSRN